MIPNRTHAPLRGLLAALAVLLSAALATAQTIQLRGGRVLLGSIEDAFPEGLRVRRLDNGGVLELRWDHLTPDAARTLKKRHGLLVEEQEELTTQAVKVEYRPMGGQPLTVTGRRLGNRDNKLILRVNGNDLPIDQRNIVSITPVQVPISLVYTPQEYYDHLLTQDPPGEDPDRHVQLGELLIRLRDYDRAKFHLEHAQELGGGINAGRIDALLERLELYKAAARERELLDRIQVARSRGRERDFQRGLELIEEFQQTFPDSRLQEDFEQEKARFEQARERFLVDQVDDKWKAAIRYVAKQYLLKNKPTLAEARAYAEQKMGEEILERVANQLELDPEEARQLFQRRAEQKRIQPDLYLYGVGSWVLGEAKIREGVDADAEGGDEGEEQSEQIRRLAEKIRAARQRAQQSQRGALDEGDPQEVWWKGQPLGEQAGWLRAYYAEESGDLELVKARNTPCRLCAGRGWLETIGATGEASRATCTQCRGTQVTRSFDAR